METTQLSELEMQVEGLIEMVERLQAENRSLRQRIITSTQDRSLLQERHQDVSLRIKSIINELKEELV